MNGNLPSCKRYAVMWVSDYQVRADYSIITSFREVGAMLFYYLSNASRFCLYESRVS